MRIEPTPGRVVWFRPQSGDQLRKFLPEGVPLAATVAFVNVDGTVNLTVHDAHGATWPRLHVKLVQEGDDIPNESYCHWMPYQRGQAERTAKAEAAAAGTVHHDLNLTTGQGTKDQAFPPPAGSAAP